MFLKLTRSSRTQGETRILGGAEGKHLVLKALLRHFFFKKKKLKNTLMLKGASLNVVPPLLIGVCFLYIIAKEGKSKVVPKKNQLEILSSSRID